MTNSGRFLSLFLLPFSPTVCCTRDALSLFIIYLYIHTENRARARTHKQHFSQRQQLAYCPFNPSERTCSKSSLSRVSAVFFFSQARARVTGSVYHTHTHTASSRSILSLVFNGEDYPEIEVATVATVAQIPTWVREREGGFLHFPLAALSLRRTDYYYYYYTRYFIAPAAPDTPDH